jgi:hypothetical protein
LLAAAALRRALAEHLVIPGHALTLIGAGSANVRAHTAGELMPLRSAEHEVGAGLAYVGAVEQQPDVRRLGMLAAELEAVARRTDADRVAAHTRVDALLHLSRNVRGGCVGHW